MKNSHSNLDIAPELDKIDKIECDVNVEGLLFFDLFSL